MHFFNMLNGYQFPLGTLVSLLAATLAPTLSPLAGLPGNLRPVTGGGPREIARVAVDLFPQAGYFGFQSLHMGYQGYHKLLNSPRRFGPLLGRDGRLFELQAVAGDWDNDEFEPVHDLNRDGIVNVLDVAILTAHFNEPCSVE
jgi:hypothetical protein